MRIMIVVGLATIAVVAVSQEAEAQRRRARASATSSGFEASTPAVSGRRDVARAPLPSGTIRWNSPNADGNFGGPSGGSGGGGGP